MATITEIELADGERFQPGALTIAIGPNNGGKSRFLRDVVSAVLSTNVPRVAVSSATVDAEQIRAAARKLIARGKDENGNYIFDGMAPDLVETTQVRPNATSTDSGLETCNASIRQFTTPHMVAHLTTSSRLALVSRKANRNPNFGGAESPMHEAFRASPSTFLRLNKFLRQAFNQDIVLDKSEFAITQFRLSPAGAPSLDGADPQAMAGLEFLDDQGDGIRAFAGVIVATALVSRPIVLIDEPEAFLHPPQAFLVGRSIATLSREDQQFIVATHSSEVLRGILRENRQVDIIRFARGSEGVSRHRLDSHLIEQIANNPVLSSARVLDGLFYEGTIVVESDGDAVLYRRVLEHLGEDGVFHFVNSYSKASSGHIIKPYAAMNVPYVVVVDFDALRVRAEVKALAEHAGVAWSDLKPHYDQLISSVEANDQAAKRVSDVQGHIEAMGRLLTEPGQDRDKLENVRRRANALRESASEWAPLKKMGSDALDEAGAASFAEIDRLFRSKGIFIVPVGERESWLPDRAPYSQNKGAWTSSALDALKDPLGEDHPLVRFIAEIVSYLRSRA